MRRSVRKGFTLIELMVVIGIILLLVSIVVFGLRHVNATAARHETIAEMNICAGMLKEYQNVNGMTDITVPRVGAVVSVTVPADNTVIAFPPYQDSPTGLSLAGPPPSFISSNDLGASASGDFGDRGGNKEPRYVAPVIARTQAIMFVLLKDPKNHLAISLVPPKRILEGAPDPTTNAATSISNDFSVVLDGWGNPIIFVPKGGMLVWMSPSGQGAYHVVRSSGTYISDATGANTGFLPAVSAADRPFFASAGQDGAFTDPQAKTDNGVDNIYSFQP